jgi:autophagy-related protein 11
VSILLYQNDSSVIIFIGVDLLHLLTDLEAYTQTRLHSSPIALDAVRSCRASLEKLIFKMDALEAGFDKIAERSR